MSGELVGLPIQEGAERPIHATVKRCLQWRKQLIHLLPQRHAQRFQCRVYTPAHRYVCRDERGIHLTLQRHTHRLDDEIGLLAGDTRDLFIELIDHGLERAVDQRPHVESGRQPTIFWNAVVLYGGHA